MNFKTCSVVCIAVAALSGIAAAGTRDDIKAGNAAYFSGDYVTAEGIYAGAITNDPTSAVLYNNRGLARFHQGSFAGADADFDVAKGVDTNYISPYINKGKSLTAQRRFDDALAELQAGLVLDTNRSAIYFNLGWVYDEKGLLAEALTNYSEALRINTNHYAAKLGRGVTYAKQGAVSSAIADFYAVINDAGSTNMLSAIAAYDLQLLRGPGLGFNTGAGATNFMKGIFSYSTEQYGAAITNLSLAQTSEPALADIPWMTAWGYLGKQATSSANSALAQAYALMQPLTVRDIGNPADIFIDGIKRGTTPSRLYLFSNGYDLTLRRTGVSTNQEWVGVTYADGTPGGSNVMLLNPTSVTNFTRFGPVVDTDRDWLADDWEMRWFTNLTKGPQGDEDHDGVSNLQEFWASTDPTRADTDRDGNPDFTEIYALGADPTVPNRFYYVNDGSRTNDVYCTAVGNDLNDGLSPSTPKATVQAIIDTCALMPGDLVLVDAGVYDLTNNITLTAADSGAADNFVRIIGARHPVTGALTTWINRNSRASGAACFQIASGDGFSLEQMRLSGSADGVDISPDGTHRLLGLEIVDNTGWGVNSGSWYENLTVDHCLLWNNGGGLYHYGGYGFAVRSCTIVQDRGTGIAWNYSQVVLSNTIVVASGVGTRCLDWSSFGSMASDYNDLYADWGAQLSGAYANLAAWRAGTGQDGHSLSLDPLFVDEWAGDYHLQSTGGSWHGGAWLADAASSPCIDAADPLVLSTDEPSPNGGRLNVGAFGGTVQASKTSVGQALVLLAPLGGEVWRGTNSITWLANGQGWVSTNTIRLEYSINHGASWLGIAGASALPYSAGLFAWDTTIVPSGAGYLLRITCNEAPSVFDATQAGFTIHNGSLTYYVNDGSRNNDVYCTAVGNDANDGLSPSTPKASVHAILDSYMLQPGDLVLVDAGVYNLMNNITLTSADSGAGTNFMRIVGARHPVSGALTTWINRNSRASGAACFQIASGDGFSLEQMRLSASADGVDISSDGTHRLLGLEIQDNTGWGVSSGSWYENLVVDHCLLWDNGGGLNHYGGYAFAVRSCTIVQDRGTGIAWNYSQVVLSNTIVVASGAGTRCLDWSSFGSMASDYNDLYAELGAQLSGSYGNMAAWRGATGQDTHSLSLDPLFVDEWAGDYHLESTAGSWHAGAWLTDGADSLCIDAGDPFAAPGQEPAPNGGRLNLGCYGGTVQASKTPSSQNLVLLSPIGGELWRGTNNIVWLPIGREWRSTDTVRLEYSTNHGAGWIQIAEASALPYAAGSFSWNTLTVPSGAGYLVRVTCNEVEAVRDLSGSLFTIHNAGLIYYVNDSSRTNDVYCTATGNDVNDGLSPVTPKASVQAILDTYDLEPGDTVLVDAGAYHLAANITLTAADSGAGTNYVRIVGARHPVTQELTTWINRNSRASGAACFQIASGDGFSLEQMRLSGSADGVDISPDGTHRLLGLEIVDNTGWGVNSGSWYENLTVDHCQLWNNGGGLYHYGGYGFTVRSCTIVQDRGTGIAWNYSAVTLANNIVVANGAGSRCLDWGSFGSVASDYNDLYADWGAQLSGAYANLVAWRAGTGQDGHSLSLDPLFVDEGAADYHLQSTGGSWHGGAWLADAADSPCVDLGDPAADYSLEPAWNGGNIDLGAYGNTLQASKSVDSDRDGLSDTLEIYRYGTNPNNPDSDGDGLGDRQEIAQGTDPNNAASWLTFIAGNVSYAGSETGTVYVVASPASFTNRVVCLTNSSAVVSIRPVSLPDAHTLEAWALFPLPATSDGWRTLFQNGGNHHHVIVDSGGTLGTYVNGFQSSGFNVGLLSPGWHLVSAVCAANRTTFFIDGNEVAWSEASETLPLAYLGNAGGANQGFGMVDEFRIWNRALSVEEIRASMRRTIYGGEPELLGCWNFDDGTARDHSGRANDGVLMNGAVVTAVDIPYFPAYAVALSTPGSYCISNLPNSGPYTVSGFRDQNDNGFSETWEPQGFFAQNPVAVIPAGVTNVNLSLRGYEFETVYETDFESGADAHWSSSLTSSNEAFTTFLGRFGNDVVTLTISNLPPHDSVRLGFDFYCIDTWDGNSGPDWFGLSSDVARAWTFSYNNGPHTYACVPDSVGQFGFLGYQDSIYRQLRDNNFGHGFVFGHTGSTLQISFYGQGLQSLDDESWGIDNIRVETHRQVVINSIVGDTTSGIQITWGSTSNQLYSVERTSDLRVGFTSVADQIPSTPPENVYRDTSATNAASFFYRIRVLP